MSKRMLIDAAHPEETRVAIVDSHNLLTEYDFKSTFKNTIKGNVYLAKVARVEPSLQAAFIDYGGNRHGFLAFSEIHPDYFRIPVADREKIEAELRGLTVVSENSDPDETYIQPDSNAVTVTSSAASVEEEHFYKMPISTVGGDLPLLEDEDGENYIRKLSLHRRYKIQEVIHRNQILLIQVVKEERGGKGAALTTYLSMPGRYCVLMPNSPRSGGISRKIANPLDRKRLRKVLDGLDIPDGMGLIIRTAGKERTKIELKRDAEYLMRLWNTIRETTLKSIAPAVIYEEDDIIKRAIRDLYGKDIDTITVEGEEGYKIARNFMKTLMPSHLKRISFYNNDTSPLFHHAGIERQIDQMHESQVVLPSGGSIIIHPTEALVSIDINSGRATRERHIEETATKTNLEAAVEIARQIRLRDLAGLIVIDFIDMNEQRNIAAVERRVKEVFRSDRARVQVGKISPFGLLELSRQRLCPSIIETSAYACPHCNATGYIRSTESKALQILRSIEEQGMSHPDSHLIVTLPSAIASYIFNKKRQHLNTIEQRHKLCVEFEFNEHLENPGFKMRTVSASLKVQKSVTVAVAEDTEGVSGNQPSGTNDERANQNRNNQQNNNNRNDNAGNSNRRRHNRRRSHSKGEAKAHPHNTNLVNINSPEVHATPENAVPLVTVEPVGVVIPKNEEYEKAAISIPHDQKQDLAASNNIQSDQIQQSTSNNREKQFRNHRRNNRRHIRSGRNKKAADDKESTASDHAEGALLHIIPTPQNQNFNRMESNANTEFEKSSFAKEQGKDNKGWWKRLLD